MAKWKKHKKYHYHRERPLTRQEKIMLAVAGVVFVMVFLVSFTYRFLGNCIFHWPIRWDTGACWNEQIAPAQYKAAESASNFLP
jgi:hypothetical protein